MNKYGISRSDNKEHQYELEKGGYVMFADTEVQSIRPHYEGTVVVLKNGMQYLLHGRNYGV